VTPTKAGLSLADALADGANSIGLSLSPSQREQLLTYIELLQQWNQVYNLTAIREPHAMLIQHVLDSLAVWPALVSHAADAHRSIRHLADIGTGAGVPGIVLAVVQPDLALELIEPVGKKAAFLEKAVGALGLRPRARVHAKRVEQVDALVDVDTFICRAFASLRDFAVSLHQHLPDEPSAADPSVVAMKGRWPEEEVLALQAHGWYVDDHRSINVPLLEAERHVLWLARSESAPSKKVMP
jgi:16S rRNA (guanine527-N7)-methyltransferase